MIDPLSSQTQGHFAQCCQVSLAKKVLRSEFGTVRCIDFALGKPLHKFIGGKINQFDAVRYIEDRVGDSLMDGYARDLSHSVGAALKMLDINRGMYIDPRVQH